MTAPASVVPLEDTALRITGVRRAFGGVAAVDVDEIRVPRGRLTALIGPNGAGKSTLFNILTGFERAERGSWQFEGEELAGMPAHAIARAGVLRTFQLTRVVTGTSVLQNMLLAAPRQHGESLWRAGWHLGWRQQEADNIERARGLLDTFRLGPMADADAAALSGGQRRLLEVARALMGRPRALLLDEPLAGVNPALREEVMAHLVRLRDEGMTILFVEHDMDAVMGLSDHVVCLATGRRIAEGTPAHVSGDSKVIDAYLGAHASDQPPIGTGGPAPDPASRPPVSTPSQSTTAADPVLRVSGLIAGYVPGRPILQGVDAYVAPGEVVAVIGPNGAGKSTLLKAIAGIVPVSEGSIDVDGVSLLGRAVHRRVRGGIGYVPQSQNVFGSLTVLENLRMGGIGQAADPGAIDRVLEQFPDLRSLLSTRAGELSGGQRQAVAMARALVPAPRLLLLDEPSAGLSPMAQERAFAAVADIAGGGVSILIVEQNARECLAISHRGYVLDQGGVALTGPGRELLTDDRVVELYLGAMHARRSTSATSSAVSSRPGPSLATSALPVAQPPTGGRP